jgi:hypothetical protein
LTLHKAAAERAGDMKIFVKEIKEIRGESCRGDSAFRVCPGAWS